MGRLAFHVCSRPSTEYILGEGYEYPGELDKDTDFLPPPETIQGYTEESLKQRLKIVSHKMHDHASTPLTYHLWNLYKSALKDVLLAEKGCRGYCSMLEAILSYEKDIQSHSYIRMPYVHMLRPGVGDYQPLNIVALRMLELFKRYGHFLKAVLKHFRIRPNDRIILSITASPPGEEKWADFWSRCARELADEEELFKMRYTEPHNMPYEGVKHIHTLHESCEVLGLNFEVMLDMIFEWPEPRDDLYASIYEHFANVDGGEDGQWPETAAILAQDLKDLPSVFTGSMRRFIPALQACIETLIDLCYVTDPAKPHCWEDWVRKDKATEFGELMAEDMDSIEDREIIATRKKLLDEAVQRIHRGIVAIENMHHTEKLEAACKRQKEAWDRMINHQERAQILEYEDEEGLVEAPVALEYWLESGEINC